MASKKDNRKDQLTDEVKDIENKIEEGKKAREKYIEQAREHIKQSSQVIVDHFRTANGTMLVLEVFKDLGMNASVNYEQAIDIQDGVYNGVLKPYMESFDNIGIEEANDWFDAWIERDYVASFKSGKCKTIGDLVYEMVVSRMASFLHDKWVELIEYEAKTSDGLEAMTEQLKEKQEELGKL